MRRRKRASANVNRFGDGSVGSVAFLRGYDLAFLVRKVMGGALRSEEAVMRRARRGRRYVNVSLILRKDNGDNEKLSRRIGINCRHLRSR